MGQLNSGATPENGVEWSALLGTPEEDEAFYINFRLQQKARITEGHEELRSSLTTGLMEAIYQAEAYRAQGNAEDADHASTFDEVCGYLMKALSRIMTTRSLDETFNLAVRRARQRLGLD